MIKHRNNRSFNSSNHRVFTGRPSWVRKSQFGGPGLVCVFLIAVVFLPSWARAGGTRIWEVAGFEELDKGKLDGTQVSSRGEVRLGHRAKKLGLEDVGLVWSAVQDTRGKIYLGTGYDGKIFRVDGRKVVLVATTDQLVVTALAVDKNGDLYIGTLPEPTIWRVKAAHKISGKKPAKAEKWVTLPKETKHVWSLVFGDDQRTLFAGTGPEGKLFAITRDGKANIYADTEEEHVLSLGIDAKGKILAGTSPNAKLLKIDGPGRVTALAAFKATEVKAIVPHGNDILVAVNTFKKPPAVPVKAKNANATGGPKTNLSNKKKKSDLGDGKLFRVVADGQAEAIWSKKKAHVVSLAVAQNGTAFAGLGVGGKVISVNRERVVHTVLDLDEREVMALITKKDLVFASTGDAGAAYAVSPARAADTTYLTPVLDAKTRSDWGYLKWLARGKFKVQSRSGNTAKPDNSWSDWSRAMEKSALVISPSARYVQLRFSWARDKNATLVSSELAFRPLNRRAIITAFDPGSPFPKPEKSDKENADELSTRTVSARYSGRNVAQLKCNWKVGNPDKDTLRFRLWYRAMGQDLWRPITERNEVVTKKEYKWDTDSIPEGRYQIKLFADDSPDNDPQYVLTDEYLSVPVLVDNHQPKVKQLSYKKQWVSGVAVDGFSEISGVEFQVDTGMWTPVFPKDGVFDELEEEFEFALPAEIDAGPHAVGVRAFDRAGNMGTGEILIEK
ncbi:MAG: hypothetical protein GY762_21650 [Proteobacteria bacterium]|nr:hypothetical protein [Pseudomonadota bacterium]